MVRPALEVFHTMDGWLWLQLLIRTGIEGSIGNKQLPLICF
jgi:hypothetical protein